MLFNLWDCGGENCVIICFPEMVYIEELLSLCERIIVKKLYLVLHPSDNIMKFKINYNEIMLNQGNT